MKDTFFPALLILLAVLTLQVESRRRTQRPVIRGIPPAVDRNFKKSGATLGKGGAIGPPGPRGPAGPRGPKGANVSKEEMFEEFRTMISELAARKLIISADPRCTELCVSNLEGNETGPVVQRPLFEQHDLLVPKLITTFMWELKDDQSVPRNSVSELEIFVPSSRTGGYERGMGDSRSTSGRFVVQRTGFYTFFIRVHLHLPGQEEAQQPPTSSELFSVLLCIEALCRENMNLEAISGFGPGQRTTVSINGMLHLEVSQYVSVFIDNASKYSFHVFEGSQFSGYLTGV
ncbi:adipolin-like [Uloborus diversus]|uniref:adipolin-like n=1 Tax=Uloborus diversus TaxID=327109 RepID=UPI002409ACF1|nr:adipolin-like [Uloborus diversus]